MKNTTIHRINWVDGMKMNKDHFIGLEDALLQQITRSNIHAITNTNYGLLAIEGEKGFNIQLSLDGRNGATVTLTNCNAITRGGFPIQINEEITSLLELSNTTISCHKEWDKEENGLFQVVLGVSPLERIAIGSAEPEEQPLRKPFVVQKYQISIVPIKQEQPEEIGAYHLTIGLIEVKNGTPNLIADYIPPCATVNAHTNLLEHYENFGNALNTIEELSLKIIQKIYRKKQSNDLARMVLAITKDIQLYTSHAIPTYRMIDKYVEPASMISRIMGLARTIQGSVNIYASTGKEALLNYLTEWCQLNQGEFEDTLTKASQLQYKHYHITESLHTISKCTTLLVQLFRKLEELEYIGKKSNSKLFVKEDIIEEEKTQTTGKFFVEE
ncbi:hypothetical protein [uncultured Maribacter sp.]|uniref:hypothetical protein n=1 Tax=uncultured Maribacter sp. TaxID=431308 RepID=UPI002631AE1D|nr:hypothetical protein [uncultured Maribacter sp.]